MRRFALACCTTALVACAGSDDPAADTAAWTITFRNRPPIPLRIVAIGGDSIVTEAGPYPSVLQQNVAVRSLRAVNRLQGDRLIGTFVARYDTDAADSVLYGSHEGTRRP